VHYAPIASLARPQAIQLRDQLLVFTTAEINGSLSFTPDARHFFIDTGASITITNAVTNFDIPPQHVQPTHLKGIASGAGYWPLASSIQFCRRFIQDCAYHSTEHVVCTRLSHLSDIPTAHCRSNG